MLMLRLASGLNFETFSARTGLDASALFPEPIERLTRLGLVRDDGQAVVLTDAGLNVADAVSAEFLDASESA
jgi:coproporphyrinogen III oxidase-like Fe-S oxidoreductase